MDYAKFKDYVSRMAAIDSTVHGSFGSSLCSTTALLT